MKPLRLTLDAVGPYPGRQVIDFRAALESRLFGIYGPTGAGKSTIFSAMTFALFGETAKPEQHATTLRSDHADPAHLTEVEFVFENHGRVYRVVRRPEQMRPAKRGGGETKEGHKAILFDVTGLDLSVVDEALPGKVVAESRLDIVNKEIISLLGYGPNQFRQIVLLPQGRFETFLAANTQDRVEILRELFDVSLYRRLAEQLKARADAAELNPAVTVSEDDEGLAALVMQEKSDVSRLLECERHVRDEAHCAVLADKVLQGLEDLLEGTAAIAVRIKTAEALVDEDGVEAYIAAGAFDDVG